MFWTSQSGYRVCMSSAGNAFESRWSTRRPRISWRNALSVRLAFRIEVSDKTRSLTTYLKSLKLSGKTTIWWLNSQPLCLFLTRLLPNKGCFQWNRLQTLKIKKNQFRNSEHLSGIKARTAIVTNLQLCRWSNKGWAVEHKIPNQMQIFTLSSSTKKGSLRKKRPNLGILEPPEVAQLIALIKIQFSQAKSQNLLPFERKTRLPKSKRKKTKSWDRFLKRFWSNVLRKKRRSHRLKRGHFRNMTILQRTWWSQKILQMEKD